MTKRKIKGTDIDVEISTAQDAVDVEPTARELILAGHHDEAADLTAESIDNLAGQFDHDDDAAQEELARRRALADGLDHLGTPVDAEWEPTEVPTLETDQEQAAYLCGVRAGETDPGYLLELAEVGRHLGSFLSTVEEAAFLSMPADEWWGRWGLGYADGATGGDVRVPRPPTPDEMGS